MTPTSKPLGDGADTDRWAAHDALLAAEQAILDCHEYRSHNHHRALEKIRAALAINGSAITRYEPIARAALERGWEFIGHGFTQKNMQKVADEREDIRKTAAAIRNFTGKATARLARPGFARNLGTRRRVVLVGWESTRAGVHDSCHDR